MYSTPWSTCLTDAFWYNSNPSNPTGAILGKEFLEKVIAIARKSNILVFSDEVYSPLFFTPDRPLSFVTMGYDRSVVTS